MGAVRAEQPARSAIAAVVGRGSGRALGGLEFDLEVNIVLAPFRNWRFRIPDLKRTIASIRFDSKD